MRAAHFERRTTEVLTYKGAEKRISYLIVWKRRSILRALFPVHYKEFEVFKAKRDNIRAVEAGEKAKKEITSYGHVNLAPNGSLSELN